MVRSFLVFCTILLLIASSCKRSEDSFYAEEVPSIEAASNILKIESGMADMGKISINVFANGNYPGYNNPAFIKDISGSKYAYCHPDVQYFPEGFKGYKYWMVFTPYFGSIGTAHVSKRYENPTIVVSNDGLNWVEPLGIKNPIARALSDKESFIEKKNEPKQAFWSDPDWLFANNQFSLYYRGCMVTAQALKNRGAKSKNNAEKLRKEAQRTVVRQTSTDGINWTPLEVVFNSNPEYTPKDDHLLSPTFVQVGKQTVSYEVELNTGEKNFKGNEASYVLRRIANDGLNFSPFVKSKIVNFINAPWKKTDVTYAPWHIHACYVDGFYFLTLAVGNVKKYTANTLYLAYSKDGVNFEVLNEPLVSDNAYRSAIFPMASNATKIQFGAILAFKTGEFRYREFSFNKINSENTEIQ